MSKGFWIGVLVLGMVVLIPLCYSLGRGPVEREEVSAQAEELRCKGGWTNFSAEGDSPEDAEMRLEKKKDATASRGIILGDCSSTDVNAVGVFNHRWRAFTSCRECWYQ